MTRPWNLAALPAFAAAVACALVGCPSTTATTTYTPITGIQIQSQPLVSPLGCGTGTTQVYKYLAVVSYANEAGAPEQGLPPVAAEVVDCFADGIFSNLPPDPSGGESFIVSIYAWNQQSFPGALVCTNAPCPAANLDADVPFEGSANWTTTCTGSQVWGATQIAFCPCPLAPRGTSGCADAAAADAGGPPADGSPGPASGTIDVSTSAFLLPDGGVLRCGTDYESAFASYDATSDAGPERKGQTPWVACPQPLVVAGASAGYSYALGVSLSNAEGGAPVGQATCTATPSPGATIAATCGAAQLGP